MKIKAISFAWMLGCSVFIASRAIGQGVKESLSDSRPFLYYSMNQADEKIRDFMADEGIHNLPTIGIHNYDDLANGQLSRAIKKAFPDSMAAGIGALDWEGNTWSILSTGRINDLQYQKAADEYLSVIKYAKTLRPNVLWGFYGLPFTVNLSAQMQTRIGSVENPERLLSACDVFFPSLYQAYSFNTWFKGDDSTYVIDNMRQILTIASKYNKPVLPYVWGRYHPGNKRLGYAQIPFSEFTEHVNRIISADVDGKRVSGIVWWGGYDVDKYYYNKKVPVLLDEIGNKSNFDRYEDSVIINCSKLIISFFK